MIRTPRAARRLAEENERLMWMRVRSTGWGGARVAALVVLTLLIGSSVAAGAPQAAGPRLTELSLEQLGDLEVITVSKGLETLRRTAAAVYVITREDIRRSGATSIPEVLRLAPGVEVARIDSDHWAVGVRGFGDQFSKSLLVLMDGRTINTPLFAGMYWPAHDALLDDIDRVEVIRGPGGTIWGSNAVNGVINIITRPATETAGTLVSTAFGAVDRASAAIRHGGRTGSLAYRAYVKGISRGPQFHAGGDDFDDWWMSQTGFRTDWSNPAGHSLAFQGDVSRGRHGQRVSLTTIEPASERADDGYLSATGVNFRARWQRVSPGGGTVRVQGYFDRTSWLAPHFGESRNTFDLDFLHRVAAVRRHELAWGLGIRRTPSVFTPVVPTLDFDPRRHTGRFDTAFLQDEIELAPGRVWLTVGSKLERNDYTGVELQPAVRALWTPGPSQTVWAALTRAVRTPSRIERNVVSTVLTQAPAPVPVFVRVVGNPDFEAERLVGYEAGYRTALSPWLYVDVAAFHNDHDNLSSFGFASVAPEGTPPSRTVAVFPYVNGVVGTSNGFEVTPEWRPSSRWLVKGSYSFLRFDLQTTPASVDVNAVSRYEGSSPHHQLRAQSTAVLSRRVELSGAYRYVSELPARLADAYHTVDLTARWTLLPGLDLRVAGQNLLQPHHVEFSHSPGPAVGIARSAQVGIVWTRETRP